MKTDTLRTKGLNWYKLRCTHMHDDAGYATVDSN